MNLRKYITLNIISFLSYIAILVIVFDYFELTYQVTWLPKISFDGMITCAFIYYFTILFFHLLFIIEFIIRISKPKLIPEFKFSIIAKIIHGIFFYIGWIFALYIIYVGTSFLVALTPK